MSSTEHWNAKSWICHVAVLIPVLGAQVTFFRHIRSSCSESEYFPSFSFFIRHSSHSHWPSDMIILLFSPPHLTWKAAGHPSQHSRFPPKPHNTHAS